MERKKIMFVFGTRPEAIKLAPVIGEVKKHPDKLAPVIVVTGQHRQMLDQVLKIFNINPDYDLKIMAENQTLADILTRSLKGLEDVLKKEKPDLLLVQGDTSTAFVSALLAYYHKIPVGHVEAGLRTFDKWRPFPEEINRKLISNVADLHFAPTQTSVNNLLNEKVDKNSIRLTGNTVIDALLEVAAREFQSDISSEKKIVLVTMHRRETFGEQQENMCRALARLAEQFGGEIEIILPVHENPKVKKVVNEALSGHENIKLIKPLAYEPFVHLMKRAHLIITDSGGIQEEAPSLGKPVLVMREKTERPEGIAAGTVKLVGVKEKEIFEGAVKLLSDKNEYDRMAKAVNPYGDGQAAGRIVKAILDFFK
ncbi:non-hydrolyzing UDP-N-acetylglucosamine 2-epimerase [Candidatus Margulisiibacteriota bacterium]